MSQQPCLPVPYRNKRRKGKKRKHQDINNNNDNNNNDNEIFETKKGFDDIQSMSASEYLLRVSQQAKKLPNIFYNKASSTTTTTTKTTKTTSTIRNNNSRNNNNKKNSSTTVVETQQQQQIIPIDGSAASLLYLINGKASLTKPNHIEQLPCSSSSSSSCPNNNNNNRKLWVDKTICNFKKLRQYLKKCKEHGIGGKQTKRIPLPPMKDRSGWHIFCVGEDEAHGNENSYFDDDGDNNNNNNNNNNHDDNNNDDNNYHIEQQKSVPTMATPKITTTTVDNNKDNDNATTTTTTTTNDNNNTNTTNGYDVSVKLILQMDQVLIRCVLSHLSYYICEGWSVSIKHCEWIYGLLARLEKPIHRDDAAILYSLLKKLTKFRSTLNVVVVNDDDDNNNNNDNTNNNDNSSSKNEGKDTSTTTTTNNNKNKKYFNQYRIIIARLNVLIVIIGIYFEQCSGYNTIMTLNNDEKIE